MNSVRCYNESLCNHQCFMLEILGGGKSGLRNICRGGDIVPSVPPRGVWGMLPQKL